MIRNSTFLVSFLLSVNAFADAPNLSSEEFKMFQQYKNALEDPRVQKMKPEARLGAIAKDAGFKLKDLQRAVEKGEGEGNIQERCERAIRSATEKLAGGLTLGKLEVDVSEPHAVVYVMWLNEDATKLNIEASLVATAAIQGCPLVSSIQLWSQGVTGGNPRLFEALITGSAARNIRPERVADFADTRYIRLFEKVKSVNNGDVFETPNAPAKSP